MAVVNRVVDEIIELEAQKKNATNFKDWFRAFSRSEHLKDEFLADLREWYDVARGGEVAFS